MHGYGARAVREDRCCVSHAEYLVVKVIALYDRAFWSLEGQRVANETLNLRTRLFYEWVSEWLCPDVDVPILIIKQLVVEHLHFNWTQTTNHKSQLGHFKAIRSTIGRIQWVWYSVGTLCCEEPDQSDIWFSTALSPNLDLPVSRFCLANR
jgi:hypothetical protein